MNETITAVAQEKATLTKATKLFNKNYLLLWQGQFVSKLGNQIYSIVIILWLTDITNSASIIGLFGMTAGIPIVLLSAFGGAVADRFSRKKIIIFSDIINGLAFSFLALLLLFNPGHSNLIMVTLFMVTILSASVNSFFGPAIAASIPDLVPEKRVAGANTMGSLSEKISVFVGQGLGGILYQSIGAPLIVLFDGLSYLVSAFSESFMKIPQKIPDHDTKLTSYFDTFKMDIKEGFKYINKNTGLKRLLLTSVILSFFSMPVIVLLPFYVNLQLFAPKEWYGFLMAIFGVGAFAGYMIVGIFRIPGRKRKRVLIIFMILEAAGYIILGMIERTSQAALLFFLGGLFSGFIMVSIVTILQITTPTNIRGRVFGALTMISASTTPLGMGLGGVIADLTDKNIPLIYITCGAIMVTWIILNSLNRDFRSFIGYETEEEMEPTGFTYKLKLVTADELLKGVDPRELYIENRIQKSRSEL